MRGRILSAAGTGCGHRAGDSRLRPAATAEPGTRSLADVLLSDGDRFDRNWNDYDILTEAVLAVLRPPSRTARSSMLTKGDTSR